MNRAEREADFKRMKRIAAGIDPDPKLSRVLSVEAVEESRDRIHDALTRTIVANGHGVFVEGRSGRS